jgi:hypothetical protein
LLSYLFSFFLSLFLLSFVSLCPATYLPLRWSSDPGHLGLFFRLTILPYCRYCRVLQLQTGTVLDSARIDSCGILQWIECYN